MIGYIFIPFILFLLYGISFVFVSSVNGEGTSDKDNQVGAIWLVIFITLVTISINNN